MSHATKEAPYGYLPNGVPRKRRSSADVRIGNTSLLVSTRYVPKTNQRKQKPADYLKYHRIVFAWARKNTGASTIEIEMMLFLYSEDIFHKTKFKEYSNIMPFDRRKLERMIHQGWIRCWRSDEDHRFKLYELSHKAKKLVNSIYKKLNGEEKISELKQSNVLMDRTNSTHKTYSIAIKKLNKKIDINDMKARHPSRTDWNEKRPRKIPARDRDEDAVF